MGHFVRLIPLQYVKAANDDRNDAATISEAASRSSLRSVVVKTVDHQADNIILKRREMRVSQRTQAINVLRDAVAFGAVAVKFAARLTQLASDSVPLVRLPRPHGLDGRAGKLRLRAPFRRMVGSDAKGTLRRWQAAPGQDQQGRQRAASTCWVDPRRGTRQREDGTSPPRSGSAACKRSTKNRVADGHLKHGTLALSDTLRRVS